MTHINGGLTSFVYGEIGNDVLGQAQSDVYGQSVEKSINFIPTPQGGMRKRDGTKTVYHHLGGKPALIPYRWTDGIERVIAISHSTISLFDKYGNLLHELYTPPHEALTHNDGLSWTQSEDILIVTSHRTRPRIIGMTDATTLTVTPISGAHPPLFPLRLNATDEIQFETDVTMPTQYKPLGLDLNVLVTTEQEVREWIDSEALIYKYDIKAITEEWAKDTLYVAGDMVYTASYATGALNMYKAAASGTSGKIGIGHDFTAGTVSDGGIHWEFQHSEEIALETTDIIDVAGEWRVQFQIADIVALSLLGLDPIKVRRSIWDKPYSLTDTTNERGSRCAAFHDGRLILSGPYNSPYIHGSYVDQFSNFAHVDANQAASFSYKIQEAYDVRFLSSNASLMIGTDRGVFIHGASSGPISNVNVSIVRQTSSPCSSVMPVKVDNVTLFVSNDGETLTELRYSEERGGLVAKNLFALRAANKGTINRLVFIDGAEPSLYISFRDLLGGDTLLASTFVPSVELIAFWQVKSLGNISDACALNQSLVLQVASGFDSSEFLCIENKSVPSMDACEAVAVSAGDSLTGREQFYGREVTCMKDGVITERIQGEQIDSIHTLTFTQDADYIGMEFDCEMKTQKVNAGNGVIQGVKRRIESVSLRLLNTGVGVFVDGGSDPSIMFQRHDTNNMDEALPLFTGDTDIIGIDQTYEAGAYLRVTAKNPYPCHVLAVWYNMFAEGV